MTDASPFDADHPPDLKLARRRKPAAELVARLPPHSPDMEAGVLGCILVSPNDCLPHCVLALRAGPECFYDLRHQALYAAMLAMGEASVPIQPLTLFQWLKDRGTLGQAGGVEYLSGLDVPSAANVSYYTDIVREKHQLRSLLTFCTETAGKVYGFSGEVGTMLDEFERDAMQIGSDRIATASRDSKQLVASAIDSIERYHQSQGRIMGLSTGFVDLDKMTDGMHPGDMIVIAARPSMGKTSLAMNIAEHNVLVNKIPVGVFSLEMTAEALMLRMLCSVARVNLRTIRDGFMTERDFPKLTHASGKLSAAPIHIDDSSWLNIIQLRAKARRMVQMFGIKLFVVDYLQLLHGVSRKAEDNRQHEIAEISGGIKSLAKELGVPIIVLSQMNRDIEKDKQRKPRMADLRESGAIEQDADLVGLLYKPSRNDDDDSEECDGVPISLVIAKQRNGPTGDVDFTFLKSFTRFESAAKVAEDVPEHRNPHNS